MRKTPNRKAPNRKASNRKVAVRKPIYELLRGVSNFSITNYLSSASGGEPGVNTGFGIVILFRVKVFPLPDGTSGGLLTGKSNAAVTQGYHIRIDAGGAGAINALASAIGIGKTYFGPVSEIGKVHLLIWRSYPNISEILLNRGVLHSIAATISSYVPSTAEHRIGTFQHNANLFASGIDIFGVAGFQGTPTLNQILDYYDATRRLRDLPTTIAGATMTHHWSVRRELLKSVDQAAEVNLVDNVTGAGADLMTRNGSTLQNVTVSEEIDGRKSYGVTGFVAQNHLQTMSPGGLFGSATGFWAGGLVKFRSGGSTFQDLVANWQQSPTLGWQLYTSTANGNLNILVNGTANVATPIASSELGVGIHVAFVYEGDGKRLLLYVNGVLRSSAVAGTYTAFNSVTYIGTQTPGVNAASGIEVFGVTGGNFVPSASEIYINAQDSLASGRIQAISGKSEHLWDFTQDIAPTELLPATIQDRIGTDHMTVTTIKTVTSGSKQGVTGFSDLTYYQSALNAGIAGQAAGFWVAVYIIVTSQAVANTARCMSSMNPASGVSGWLIYTTTTNAGLRFNAANGVGSSLASPSYTITAGDVSGAVALLAVGVHDGSNLRLYVKGVEVGSGTAITGYTAPTGFPMGLGNGAVAFNLGRSFDDPPDGILLLGLAGGNGVPTLGEISTMDTACASANDIVAIPGKTDHLWSLKQDIADAGGALPVKSTDRVGTDDLYLIGSGLQVSPRTERVWSYETSPIWYGATAFSNTNYYSVAGGFGGTDKGFWVCWVGIITSQAVSSATRILLAKRDGTTPGWEIRTTGTNSLFSVAMGSATNASTTGTSSISSTEVGKIFVVIATYDSSGRIRWYLRRVENGSGTNLTGNFLADAAAMTMGKRSDGNPADGVTCLGFSCGDGTATLPEVQALHDTIMAKERIAGIPGKTSMLVDVTLDAVANGGVLPTVLTDRVGSQHMSMNGTVTQASQYARPWVW